MNFILNGMRKIISLALVLSSLSVLSCNGDVFNSLYSDGIHLTVT